MSPQTLDALTRGVVLDVLLGASEAYWLRRADDFAKVGTPHCDTVAQACRNKAALVREESTDEWRELLALELGEAA